MYLIYSFLLTAGFVLLLPRFAIDAFRSGKYITGIRERFGQIPVLDRSAGAVIWLHCVSVGEIEAARPLVRALCDRFPDYRLVISTTTVTGQQVARRAFAQNAAAIFYFPIDWSWTVRRVLRALNPSAMLLMETEIWPNLLRECRRGSIPVALVNGRISPNSYRRYLKLRRFMRCVLDDLTAAFMQSDEDAERISILGLADNRIKTFGNLKFDSTGLPVDDGELASEIRSRFKFKPTEPLIVAASTHSPEEKVVIDAYQTIKKTVAGKASRLLIAPRHPERFEEVAGFIAESGFSWTRRSAPRVAADAISEVILLDSIGELRATFQLAEIAFVGGSIIPHGGQNVLEPAAQGVCVITGAHTQNFAAITRVLLANDAMLQLADVSIADAPAALSQSLLELLRDETRRKTLGCRAQNVCARYRGATQRTVEMIADLMETPATNKSVPFSALQATATK